MGRAEARWLKEWAGGGRGTYGGGMRPGCARWGACAVSGLAADAFPPAQEGGAYALVSSAKNETTASRSFFVVRGNFDAELVGAVREGWLL